MAQQQSLVDQAGQFASAPDDGSSKNPELLNGMTETPKRKARNRKPTQPEAPRTSKKVEHPPTEKPDW